jgi:hypothetical protein
MLRPVLLLTLLLCPFRFIASGAADPAPRSLAQTLSAEEFSRSGLNKLTAEELAYLDAALARRQPPSASNPAPKSKTPEPRRSSPDAKAADFGAEQVAQAKAPAKDFSELHTQIEGTVQEFSGRAVFVMANGQIWQQRTPTDVYLPKKLVNPNVTLLRGAAGYKMVIDDANVVILVKRIQ